MNPKRLFFRRLFTVSTLVVARLTFAVSVPDDIGVRVIPLAADAYSGSSVNVVAGARQSLYTDSVYQYAGFYNGDGRLVLAKRRLGEDTWERRITRFSMDVQDAHNSVSLIVDGAGFLHVAWNQHNTPLSYAVSKAPGSLEMGETRSMVGQAERRVSYPQFFRLNDGDLLFLYRDGGSGDGRVVLNHYDVQNGRWLRRHDNLIDGESERSAYWDMTVDVAGVLHLAWIWREAPDVASNHDIAYARSGDGGLTWQTSEDKPYKLPVTEVTAEVVAKIGRGHSLMNPPSIDTGRRGRPFISTYWSPAPGKRPRFHVVYRDENRWRVVAGPEAGEDFDLKGLGTRRPPISRAALLVESDWEQAQAAHLVYRDDRRGGRIVAATLDLSENQWRYRDLTGHDVGAWEPSVDPAQWRRMKQAHLLLQSVDQLDGDDKTGSRAPPSDLGLLVWSPVWERHQERASAGDTHQTSPRARGDMDCFDRERILDYAERVAKWQWDHIPQAWHYHPKAWGVCPLYIGMLDIAEYLPEAGLEARVLKRARANEFEPRDHNLYDADGYCVIQAYLRLHQEYRDPAMLAPSKARLDTILANPTPATLDWGLPDSRERWSWCDSLFMGPMSWLLMWEITDDERYLEFMNREWWRTTERLYREQIGLYFRDESYLDLRERNGKTIHWARGNGWVVAGLVQVIEHLPDKHPDNPRYVALYRRMVEVLMEAQQPDGLWRPGLLDPDTHDARETSGSAFITFAFAAGINQGLLDRKTYLPAVNKAWAALTASVTDNGKLRNVQPVGAGPHGFDPDNAEAFASGAFLLLARELYELVGNDKTVSMTGVGE